MSPITERRYEGLALPPCLQEFDPKKKISDADFHTIWRAAACRPVLSVLSPGSFWWSESRPARKIRAVSWGAQHQLPTASHFVVIMACKPAELEPDSLYIQDTIMRDTQHLSEDISGPRTEKYRGISGQTLP